MSDSLSRFRDFDFDSNAQWQQYKANLEFPANSNREAALEKLKAKWYRREVDPKFDASSVKGEEAKATTSSQSSQSTGSIPTNGRKVYSEENRQARQEVPKGGLLGKLQKLFFLQPEDRLFFLHLVVIFFGVLHLQPLVSTPTAWARFLQAAAITHGYKVSQRFGLPQVWPFKLDTVATYFKSVSPTTDFQYLMMALVFIPSRPLILVMVPFLTLAVYHVAAYAANHYSQTTVWRKFCTRPYQWLAVRQKQALVVNAAAEIGSGFLVILNLLTPPRNIFLVFIHWQWLRMRFWSPDSASNHRMVWGQLNAKFGRYLDLVPILKVPVGYIQRWFESAQTLQR